MSVLSHVKGLEILDSRGRPTVQAVCELESGASGTASVPAGASRGSAEALELRDGDIRRFRGLGCRKAVDLINQELDQALSGRTFLSQDQFDRTLIELDGTHNKSRLGSNTVLALSLSFARAAAAEESKALYLYLSALCGSTPGTLPRPAINLFSGGKHAGEQVSIQDVLVVPVSAGTISETLSVTYEIYQTAAELIARKYQMRTLRADEGGLAPPVSSPEQMIEDALQAIEEAGLQPGNEVAIAIDAASSQFYRGGCYHLGDRRLSSAAMVELLLEWLDKYPIISIEDGLSEEDWESWVSLRARAADRIWIVGDDLLCTHPSRIRRAAESTACNTLLLKVNQIGTLTEAAEALKLARSAGWNVIASARSGDTEDNWLADLAVGWSADQIKIGSITQSERLSKYNRLLALEEETGFPLKKDNK
ncbi:MAG: phosphopyruvate hydratase [Acidobacteriota bacterium]